MIYLLLLFSSSLIAMKNQKPYELPDPSGICHLARVPKDVQDLIAEHLIFNDRETDKEFIARAQQLYEQSKKNQHYLDTRYGIVSIEQEKKEKGAYYSLVLTDPKTQKKTELYTKYFSKKEDFRVLYSFDEDYDGPAISLRLNPQGNLLLFIYDELQYSGFDRSSYYNNYEVYDLSKSKQITDNKFRGDYRKYDKFQTAALAHRGLYLARVVGNYAHIQRRFYDTEGFWAHDFKEEQNESDEQRKERLKKIGKLVFCEFNKQATKFMFLFEHGHRLQNLFMKKNGDERYLKWWLSEKEEKAKSKKTLVEYFRQKLVCKNLNDRSKQKLS